MSKEIPHILYKLASRSRPSKFFDVLDAMYSLADLPMDRWTVVASLDLDDSTMNTPEVKEKLRQYPNLKAFYGVSKNKVDAINRDINVDKGILPDWDILVNVSDDMFFFQKGFDTKIATDIFTNFPDSDGVVHYPDGNQAGNVLMTMSIMGRKYYNRFTYIYNGDYTSLWCDNEATDVAKILNKYVWINTQIFEHRHPAFGKAETDKQYKHTESFYHADKKIYDKRKAANFGLNKIIKQEGIELMSISKLTPLPEPVAEPVIEPIAEEPEVTIKEIEELEKLTPEMVAETIVTPKEKIQTIVDAICEIEPSRWQYNGDDAPKTLLKGKNIQVDNYMVKGKKSGAIYIDGMLVCVDAKIQPLIAEIEKFHSENISIHAEEKINELYNYLAGENKTVDNYNSEEPLLSIIIPTLSSRSATYNALEQKLMAQIAAGNYPCKILSFPNRGNDPMNTIGTIRNKTLNICDTKYCCFFDDDDIPADNYVSSIFKALLENPDIDAIGFEVDYNLNGKSEGLAVISNDYSGWKEEKIGKYRYIRTINHLGVVKTALAKEAKFPEINHGEDFEYSKRLKPMIKTWVTIPETLYHYLHCTDRGDKIHKPKSAN